MARPSILGVLACATLFLLGHLASMALGQCSVDTSGAGKSFTPADVAVSTAANFFMLGSASTTASELVLTNTTSSEGVAVWLRRRARISGGFTATFAYSTGATPNGLAFVMQSLGSTARGGSGMNLGYSFARSIAVELDMFQDAAGETNGNHCEIHSCWAQSNSATSECRIGTATPLGSSLTLAGSTSRTVTIRYVPTTGSLTATTENGGSTVTLASATISAINFNTLFPDGSAYIGFTSATSDPTTRAASKVAVSSFAVTTVGISAANSRTVSGVYTATVTASDAFEDAASTTFRLYDNCNNTVTGDSYEVATASVEANANFGINGLVDVVSLGDGSYTIRFRHTVAGVHAFSVLVNGVTSRSFSYTVVAAEPSVVTSALVADPPASFTAGVAVPLQVQLRDRFRNPYTGSARTVTARFGCCSDFAYSSVNTATGVYSFSASTTTASPSTSLEFKLAGVNIDNSPYTIDVDPGPVKGSTSFLGGAGLAQTSVGTATTIYLNVVDQYGNSMVSRPSTDPELFLYQTSPSSPVSGGTLTWSAPRYEYTYTTTVAGTYRVQCTAGGEACRDSSTLQTVVSPGALDATKTTLTVETAAASRNAGVVQTISIDPRDTYGNSRGRENPSASAFVVTLSTATPAHSQTVTCSSQGSVVSGAAADSASCFFHSSNKYRVTFTPRVAASIADGSEYTIAVAVGASSVSTTLTVKPGTATADQSVLTLPASGGLAGQSFNAIVTAKDRYGNPTTPPASIELLIYLPAGVMQNPDIGAATVAGADWSSPVTLRTAGDYSITATLGGRAVSVKDFSLRHGAFSLSNSLLVGDKSGVVGTERVLSFFSRDAYGNALIIAGLTCTVDRTTCAVGSSAEPGEARTVTYTVPSPSGSGNPFTVSLSVVEAGITQSFGQGIPYDNGNQYGLLFVPGSVTPEFQVGAVPAPLTLQNQDQAGANITTSVTWSAVVYSASNDALAPTAATVLIAPTTSAVATVTITPRLVGNYRLRMYANAVQTAQSSTGAGITFNVVVGVMSTAHSTVAITPAGGVYVAGSALTVFVTPFDAEGNRVTTAESITFRYKPLFGGSSIVIGNEWDGSTQVYKSAAGTVAPSVAGSYQLIATDGSDRELNSAPTFTVTPAVLSTSTLVSSVPCQIGELCSLTLTPRDQYNNAITDLSQSSFALFAPQRTAGGPASLSASVDFSLSPAGDGTFVVTFTPTYLLELKNQVDVKVGTTTVATATVSVTYAAAPDVTLSTVTGVANLASPGNAVITVAAKDIYGNIWSAVPTDYEFSLKSAGSTTVIGADSYVADEAAGTMTVTTFVRTAAEDYSWIVIANGVTLNTPTVFSVQPGIPVAANTLQSAPNSRVINVDDGPFSFDIVAYDAYNNRLKINSPSAVFSVAVYEGRFGCDATTKLPVAVDGTSTLATSFFTGGNTDKSFVMFQSDGLYTVKLNTTRANSFGTVNRNRYYYVVMLNNVLIRTCSQLSDTVQVLPGALSGAHSVLSGVDLTAIEAGTPVSLRVQYADKYSNAIRYETGSTLPKVTANAPVGTCDGSVYDQAVADPKETFATVTFTIETASTSEVKQFVGIQVDNQDVLFQGSACIPFVVHHSYPYTWTLPTGLSLSSGRQQLVPVTVKDRYGNHVNLNVTAPAAVNSFSFSLELRLQSSTFTLGSSPVVYTYNANSNAHAVGDTDLFVPFAPLWPGTYDAVLAIVEPTVRARPTSALTQSLSVSVGVCAQIDATKPYQCLSNGACEASPSACGGYTANCAYKCLIGGAYTCTDDISLCECHATQKKCTGASGSFCVPTASACPTSAFPTATAPSQRHCSPDGYLLCTDGSTCVEDSNDCPLYATCAAGTVSCPNGSCAASGDECPSGISCPASAPILCSDNSCVNDAINCPSSRPCLAPRANRCADGSCVANVVDCPSSIVCPPGSILCASGFCAASVADCPAAQACAEGYVRCSDGSCKADVSFCATKPTCLSGQVLCPDGSSCASSVQACNVKPFCPMSKPVLCPSGECASEESLCSTALTCPNDAPVRCADNSCVVAVDQCAGVTAVQCPEQAPVRCPDGTCHKTGLSCSSGIQCPPHRPLKCPDARCVSSPADCASATVLTCPTGQFRCHSGMCAPHALACPTVVTCSAGQVRCPDGSCRSECTDRALDPPACADGLVQCPLSEAGVHCAANLAACPQGFTCPRTAPVRCSDQTCASDESECEPVEASLIPSTRVPCAAGAWASSQAVCGAPVTCPASQPAKCWDESCRRVPEDCPPLRSCSVDAPFLCSDGSCQLNLWSCSTARCTDASRPIRCPAFSINRGCVASLSECLDVEDLNANVLVQCPAGQRCWDGSCSTELRLCPARTCPRHLPVLCPNGACAESTKYCPLTNGCPWDKPVFCAGSGSCAASTGACPSSKTCDEGLTLCPDGTCRTRDVCLGVTAFGCSTASPVVCHDKRCAAMPTTTGAPYACADTSDSYNACPASRPFRCAGGFCAVSSTRCPVAAGDVTSSICGYDSEGRAMPVHCDDGSCAYSFAQCPVIVPCGEGELRCPDGTCKTLPCDPTRTSCRDLATSVFNTEPYHGAMCSGHNSCPAARPHRCQDGLCAASSSDCIDEYPVILQSCCADDLPYSRPTVSAPYGSCGGVPVTGGCTNPKRNGDVSSGCPELYTRCASGACLSPSSSLTCAAYDPAPASVANGCPSASPFKCADGSCATTSNACARGANGCLVSQVLCADGECKAPGSCTASSACSATLPFRCSNKHCAASAAECLMPQTNCPADAPIRCANGDCKAFAALAGGADQSNRCQPTIVCDARSPYLCDDGSCVTASSFCRPTLPCASGVRCPKTGVCMASLAACAAAAASCPVASPFVCPNGACAGSAGECSAAFPTARSASCPSSSPVRCHDGSCVATPAACVQMTVRAFAEGQADWDAATGAVPVGSLCPIAGGYVCPNGQCARSAGECDTVAACTINTLRCPDGTCAASCPTLAACPSGSVRCEDGTCRAWGSCPAFEGCALSSPYACYASKVQCTENAAACSSAPAPAPALAPFSASFEPLAVGDEIEGQEVCATSCERSVPATRQAVIVSGARDTALDISSNDRGVPRTVLTIPSGAFTSSVRVAIEPIPTVLFDLPSSFSGSLPFDFSTPTATGPQPGYYATKVLSTPFHCSHTDASSGATAEPGVGLVVTSHVDIQTYGGSDGGGTTTGFSCELQGDWDAAVLSTSASVAYSPLIEMSAAEVRARVARIHALRDSLLHKAGYEPTTAAFSTLDTTCAGQLDFDGVSASIAMDTCASQFNLRGTYASTSQILPWSGETSEQKLTLAVTASDTPALVGKTICLFVQRISDLLFVSFPPAFSATASDEELATCSDAPTGVYITAVLVPDSDPNAVDPCSRSAQITDQVAKQDICLARFTSSGKWQCVYDTRAARVSSPVWQTGMGTKQVSASLPSCTGVNAFAFINEPLPPAPEDTGDNCDWWCDYGKIVIIVLSVFGGLLILGVLFGMKVYRDRVAYKKEQAKITELKAQAADLNEFAGGAGYADADGEIRMVMNPLVLQMQELERDLAEANRQLGTAGEQDEHRIQQLELQRNRIAEEMRRTADEIKRAEAASAPKATRVPAGGPPALQGQASFTGAASPPAPSPSGDLSRPLQPQQLVASSSSPRVPGSEAAPALVPQAPRRRQL